MNREPPSIIDSKPRQSAFKTQDLQRPTSCFNSFNVSSSSSYNQNDKFTERINAMLQNDLETDRNKSRASSTTSGLNDLLNNNKHIMNEFNSQIKDLSNKNLQAQQKLKHFQLEPIEARDLALDKLKKEQELIREQINLLNKQKESASIELEVLSLTSSSSNMLSKVNKRGNNSPSLSPISLTDNIYPVNVS